MDEARALGRRALRRHGLKNSNCYKRRVTIVLSRETKEGSTSEWKEIEKSLNPVESIVKMYVEAGSILEFRYNL